QPRPIVAVLAPLPALTLPRFAWTERPQLMGLFCFTLLLFLLRVAWERPRVLIAVPPLILLWANLHASFVLGLALALIAMVILGLRRAELRTMLAVIAGASLAATLLTPSGAAIWTSASGHFLSPPRMVLEEGFPDVAQPYGVVFVLIILASLVTAALARPVPLFQVALMVPVLFVSMTAARHTPFFAVASAPYLAARGPEAVAAIAAGLRIRPRLPALRSSVPPVAVDVVTALLAIVAVVGGGGTARAPANLEAQFDAIVEALRRDVRRLRQQVDRYSRAYQKQAENRTRRSSGDPDEQTQRGYRRLKQLQVVVQHIESSTAYLLGSGIDPSAD